MPYECAACIANGLMLKRWMPSYTAANSYSIYAGRSLPSGVTTARKSVVRRSVSPRKLERKPAR